MPDYPNFTEEWRGKWLTQWWEILCLHINLPDFKSRALSRAQFSQCNVHGYVFFLPVNILHSLLCSLSRRDITRCTVTISRNIHDFSISFYTPHSFNQWLLFILSLYFPFIHPLPSRSLLLCHSDPHHLLHIKWATLSFQPILPNYHQNIFYKTQVCSYNSSSFCIKIWNCSLPFSEWAHKQPNMYR